MSSLVHFTQHGQKLSQFLYNLFQNTEAERIFPNSFLEYYPNAKNRQCKKKTTDQKLSQPTCNNLQQNISILNSTIHKKNYKP